MPRTSHTSHPSRVAQLAHVRTLAGERGFPRELNVLTQQNLTRGEHQIAMKLRADSSSGKFFALAMSAIDFPASFARM